MSLRDTGWTHRHVVGGDQSAVSAYEGEGRKLLGYVRQDASNLGLQTHKAVRRLADGAVITAELRGGIPRITIQPPSIVTQTQPSAGRDAFVVWARTSALPDGIDAEHPEQILRPRWRTFFFDEDIAGFDAFAGDKGTYVGTFPDGVRHAGNVDWCSHAGERLSWYGPSSRYWYDAYREPQAQYGRFVFCLGQVLLDVDAYCTDAEVDLPERYVLGAARVGPSLYVVMADLPAAVTWPDPPPTAAQTPDGWASPRYPVDPVPVVLRRFTLADDPAATTPMRLRVIVGSHDDLWADSLGSGAAPWHFDESGRTAVAHLPPANAQIVQRGAAVVPPSTSHVRIALAIDGDTVEVTTEALSMPPGSGAAGVIAEDGQHRLEVVRRTVDGDPDALVYRLDGIEHRAISVHFVPGEYRYVRRQLVWADLRSGVLLLWVDAITFQAGWHFDAALVLCARGIETVLWGDSNTTATFGAGDALHVTLGRLDALSVAPLAVAYLHAFGVITLGGNTRDAGVALLHHPQYPPFRKSDTFGEIRWAFSAGAWSQTTLIVNIARDLEANQQVDVHGHTTLPGFATFQGSSVLSYSMNAAINGARVVLNYASGSTLEALTGVAGTDTTENGTVGYDARYHPIWLLGEPPAGLT